MLGSVCLQVFSNTLYRLLWDHTISIEEFHCLDDSSKRFVRAAAIRLVVDSMQSDNQAD